MYAIAHCPLSPPAEEVIVHQEPHRAYLRQLKADGILLAAGPQDPRIGGHVPAARPGRQAAADLDKIRDDDPFYQPGVAQYELLPWKSVIGKEDLDKSVGTGTGRPADGRRQTFQAVAGSVSAAALLLPCRSSSPSVHDTTITAMTPKSASSSGRPISVRRDRLPAVRAAPVISRHDDADDEHRGGADQVVPEEADRRRASPHSRRCPCPRSGRRTRRCRWRAASRWPA